MKFEILSLALLLGGHEVWASAQAAEQIPVLLPPYERPDRKPNPAYSRERLQLRQIFHHGTRKHAGLHRKIDIAPHTTLTALDEDNGAELTIPELWIQPRPMNIKRLGDRSPARVDALQRAGQARGSPLDLPVSAWTVDTVKGPNYTDRETVLTFGRMTYNTYIKVPNSGDWKEIGRAYNYTEDFGWEQDGLRGHVFADAKNQTVVIGLKGTTPAVFDGEDTTTNDKINDNLFFSCCCGQGGSASWRQVCDCRTETYTCNSTCLTKSLQDRDKYYDAAKNLYHNVTEIYPGADIWLTGHSLGGALSSLLGITYGLPVITFGAPGDEMPAKRLGLPIPPINETPGDGHDPDRGEIVSGTVHFGHTADPIYQGSCSGWSSTCSIAGYAMQSICHTGLECRYDTVADKGWHNNMLNHRIKVTYDVLEMYPELPKCEATEGCLDCYSWNYFESNSSTAIPSKSSSTASFTQTRTQTCMTPGWWGCLDETSTSSMATATTPITTTTTTTTTSTSTSSTSTCQTPGWFGCRDSTTTTATTELTTARSSRPASATASTTCEFFDVFWCHPCRTTATSVITTTATATATSKFTITSPPTATTSVATTSVASSTSSCNHPGLFWGCRDNRKRKLKLKDYKGDVGTQLPEDPWIDSRSL